MSGVLILLFQTSGAFAAFVFSSVVFLLRVYLSSLDSHFSPELPNPTFLILQYTPFLFLTADLPICYEFFIKKLISLIWLNTIIEMIHL